MGGVEADCDRIRGPWSPEEDEALRRLVERHGARNWTAIGREIPGRSGKSCRLRWCNQLSPQEMIRAEVHKYMASVGVRAGCGDAGGADLHMPQLLEGVMRAAAERVGGVGRTH
uniref:Uncharacterized protein n=1 Tax=Oryza brachyantha TaxID=4533 RepID=J3MG43_ORYBR